MKMIKAMCAALVLAFALCLPVYADEVPGDIHTPGVTTPVASEFDTALASADSTLTGSSTVDGSTDLPTFEDLFWALTLIY
ncbi:MAG TPA: hypothetical protein VK208_21630 [Pyrinomonadaceae bacterium]|nr:hypothetical protein [Pyrinomonadaceae bacterium]